MEVRIKISHYPISFNQRLCNLKLCKSSLLLISFAIKVYKTSHLIEGPIYEASCRSHFTRCA